MTPLPNQDDSVPFVLKPRIGGICFSCKTRFEDHAFTVVLEEYTIQDGIIGVVKSTQITTGNGSRAKEYKICYDCAVEVLSKCNPRSSSY